MPFCQRVHNRRTPLQLETTIIERLATDLETKLALANNLRQSILRHAFSGKLVPQDPNDEPAVALLKRIAVERKAPETDQSAWTESPDPVTLALSHW